MIVDDEALIRRLVSDFLRNSGYEPVEAVNGLDAIEKFKSEQNISLVSFIAFSFFIIFYNFISNFIFRRVCLFRRDKR